MTQTLVLDQASLPEFFKEKVSGAISEMELTVSEHAEFYLVNLLTTFTKTEKLFETTPDGEMQDKALALQLFDAMMATPHQRLSIFKRMGDIALYTSGFFADSLYRKIVDIDYYIQMGHTAYSSASRLLHDESGTAMRDLFGELAHKFPQLVDVLSSVADSANLTSDQNLLKLYERWMATGSQKAQELLSKGGIIPNKLAKTRHPQ